VNYAAPTAQRIRQGGVQVSRSELIDAYRSGRIGRRDFIRRMVTIGLSASTATALADRVRAAPAAGAAVQRDQIQDDTYSAAVG
jgi:hypothetical protein